MRHFLYLPLDWSTLATRTQAPTATITIIEKPEKPGIQPFTWMSDLAQPSKTVLEAKRKPPLKSGSKTQRCYKNKPVLKIHPELKRNGKGVFNNVPYTTGRELIKFRDDRFNTIVDKWEAEGWLEVLVIDFARPRRTTTTRQSTSGERQTWTRGIGLGREGRFLHFLLFKDLAAGVLKRWQMKRF